MTNRRLAATALVVTLALPIGAHAGGLALGGPPSGWGGGYSGGPSQPDRDRINDEWGGCSNRIMCPRWMWLGLPNPNKRQEPDPKPTPVVDPIPDLERPGEGIPGDPGDETPPETPGEGPQTPGVTDPDPVSPVPIPAAGWLLALGLGGIAALRRRGR